MIEKITPQIARLYIGQKATRNIDAAFFTIESVSHWSVSDGDRIRSNHGLYDLHLRSLDSLTEFEAQELFKIATAGVVWEKRSSESYLGEWWNSDEYFYVDVRAYMIGSPLIWLKLLEWGFDLFGLIPAGLAKEIPAQ